MLDSREVFAGAAYFRSCFAAVRSVNHCTSASGDAGEVFENILGDFPSHVQLFCISIGAKYGLSGYGPFSAFFQKRGFRSEPAENMFSFFSSAHCKI